MTTIPELRPAAHHGRRPPQRARVDCPTLPLDGSALVRRALAPVDPCLCGHARAVHTPRCAACDGECLGHRAADRAEHAFVVEVARELRAVAPSEVPWPGRARRRGGRHRRR